MSQIVPGAEQHCAEHVLLRVCFDCCNVFVTCLTSVDAQTAYRYANSMMSIMDQHSEFALLALIRILILALMQVSEHAKAT